LKDENPDTGKTTAGYRENGRRLRVGVLTRGKYGLRLVDTIREHTPFDVRTARLPHVVPEFTEEPCSLLAGLNADDVWETDLLVAYALHTDLALAVIGEAARRGVKALILPGGVAIARDDLNGVRRQHPIEVVLEEVCCSLVPASHGKEIAEFARYLGRPRFRLDVEDGLVSAVEVLVGVPCGGSWHVARELVGVPVEDAPRMAALFIQYYPCRATRGGLSWDSGNIHVAAEIMAKAVEEAIKIRK